MMKIADTTGYIRLQITAAQFCRHKKRHLKRGVYMIDTKGQMVNVTNIESKDRFIALRLSRDSPPVGVQPSFQGFWTRCPISLAKEN